MPDYRNNIPSKIRGARAEKRITQEQLAELLNVSEQTIVNWESGKTGIPFDKACEIADVLECSLDRMAGR